MTQTRSINRALSTLPPKQSVEADKPAPAQAALKKPDLHENIYTVPNALTLSRILACPLLGYYIVQSQFMPATILLFYAGVSDLVRIFLCLLSRS